jgi:RNA polymerase sigma-70 factor (ECF subfamily)
MDDSGYVGELVSRLPRAQQRVLALRFVYDMSAGEIAEVVGSSADAVRHAQQRALQHLSRDLCPPAGKDRRRPAAPTVREPAAWPR